MATGDILSITIRSDGWSCDVVIEGFSTGATYDFGLGAKNADLGASKFIMTVVSEGYSSSGSLGTTARKVYGTAVVRKPYPDQATLDETASGGNLTVRVALSDFVYDDDKNGGAGTSGTDPSAKIAAGWCTSGGTPNNAASGLTCTNSSTLDYAVAIGQWDNLGLPGFYRVQSDFSLGCIARHRSGVACVILSCVGASSAHADSATLTVEAKRIRTATGLYGTGYYSPHFVLADYTQGEQINCRMRVYPVVGDANSVLDSDSFSGSDECLGYTPISITCDKTGALIQYAVVDTGGADPGTVSATLATAEADPFLTIGRAIQAGATLIYLNDGTHAAVGDNPSARVTTNYWIEVRPHPSSTTATVQITTVKDYKCQRLMYRSLPISLLSTASWLDGEAAGNYLAFLNCAFDSAGIGSPTTGPGYRSNACYFSNCTGDLGDTNWRCKSYSTASVAHWFDGCVLVETATAVGIGCWYRVVACLSTGANCFIDKESTNPRAIHDGCIFEFNKFVSHNTTSNPILKFGAINAIARGMSILGNVIERTTGTNPAMQIAADGSTVNVHNILIWNNSIAGERCNLGYNETGTTAYNRNNWSMRFNAFRDFNNKDDTYPTENANRIGSWAVGYAVGFYGNRYEIANFRGEYDGLDSALAGDDAMGYTDDNSYTGHGGGSGDYTPRIDSPLNGRVLTGWIPALCDLDGRGIVDGGCAGAIQRKDRKAPRTRPPHPWRPVRSVTRR